MLYRVPSLFWYILQTPVLPGLIAQRHWQILQRTLDCGRLSDSIALCITTPLLNYITRALSIIGNFLTIFSILEIVLKEKRKIAVK
jgi:hypothetical protein